VCVCHDRIGPGIESQGHMSRSKVNIQGLWAWQHSNAVGLTSILGRGQFF